MNCVCVCVCVCVMCVYPVCIRLFVCVRATLLRALTELFPHVS